MLRAAWPKHIAHARGTRLLLGVCATAFHWPARPPANLCAHPPHHTGRRGENVVLLGELDLAREPPAGLELVSEAAIKQAQRAEREADKMKGTLRARFDFLDDV